MGAPSLLALGAFPAPDVMAVPVRKTWMPRIMMTFGRISSCQIHPRSTICRRPFRGRQRPAIRRSPEPVAVDRIVYWRKNPQSPESGTPLLGDAYQIAAIFRPSEFAPETRQIIAADIT